MQYYSSITVICNITFITGIKQNEICIKVTLNNNDPKCVHEHKTLTMFVVNYVFYRIFFTA